MRTTTKKLTKPQLLKAVKYVGGVVLLAKKLGVSHSCVSNWLYNDIKIKRAHCVKIEKITNGLVKKEKLRPDLFKGINVKLQVRTY